jgi:hypothetical protein
VAEVDISEKLVSKYQVKAGAVRLRVNEMRNHVAGR